MGQITAITRKDAPVKEVVKKMVEQVRETPHTRAMNLVAEYVAQLEKEYGHQPQYRVTERCYLDDCYLDPETMPRDKTGSYEPMYVEFRGIPAAHMEPMNEAAEAMYAKYQPVRWRDPVEQLALVSEDFKKDPVPAPKAPEPKIAQASGTTDNEFAKRFAETTGKK